MQERKEEKETPLTVHDFLEMDGLFKNSNHLDRQIIFLEGKIVEQGRKIKNTFKKEEMLRHMERKENLEERKIRLERKRRKNEKEIRKKMKRFT